MKSLTLWMQTCLTAMRHVRWKNILFALAAVMLVAGISGCASGGGCCGSGGPVETKEGAAGKPADVSYYTCTMHPSVRSSDPKGKCPICGMNLTAVKKEGGVPQETRP